MQDIILDDYEHRITNTIDAHEHEESFPRMEDYSITKKELTDYLYDKQLILDSEGSEKSQYTLYGTLAIVPVLCLAVYPINKLPGGYLSVIAALAAGLVLSATVKLCRRLLMRHRLKKLAIDNIERYLSEVEKYREQKTIKA